LKFISDERDLRSLLKIDSITSLAISQPPSIKIAPIKASKASSKIEFFLSLDKLAVPLESLMYLSSDNSSALVISVSAFTKKSSHSS